MDSRQVWKKRCHAVYWVNDLGGIAYALYNCSSYDYFMVTGHCKFIHDWRFYSCAFGHCYHYDFAADYTRQEDRVMRNTERRGYQPIEDN